MGIGHTVGIGRVTLTILITLASVSISSAQVSPDSPRMTPLVKVIQEIEPAVIGLFIPGDGPGQIGSGSGSIIHPDGYVLTNDHVVRKPTGFAIYRGKPIRFGVVGRLPEKDLAIVKLLGVSPPFPTVPLGHSYDVMNGETIVVSGNPGGRGIVVTSGIISSRRQLAMNAFVMTQFAESRRDSFIQFDAASNAGNSGGPLVNMEGKLIGIVAALMRQEQNVGLAIPVDRMREMMDRIVEPELIHELAVGVTLNPQADQGIVTDVAKGSSAAKAGLQIGDVIQQVAGRKIRYAADWTLTLNSMLPTGDAIDLVVLREGDTIPMKLVPQRRSPTESVEIAKPKPGLKYEYFHGLFNRLPDFSELEPEKTDLIDRVNIKTIRGDREEKFAVIFEGFINIPTRGLHRMSVMSDDGSRVYFHDKLLIDHDGNHPPTPMSRQIRVEPGLHPIHVEYYQGIGGLQLQLKVDQLNADGTETLVETEYFYDDDAA